MQLDNKVLTSTKNTMHAKSMDLIGHSKILPWQELDGSQCNQTLCLSAKGLGSETE